MYRMQLLRRQPRLGPHTHHTARLSIKIIWVYIYAVILCANLDA